MILGDSLSGRERRGGLCGISRLDRLREITRLHYHLKRREESVEMCTGQCKRLTMSNSVGRDKKKNPMTAAEALQRAHFKPAKRLMSHSSSTQRSPNQRRTSRKIGFGFIVYTHVTVTDWIGYRNPPFLNQHQEKKTTQ